MRKHTVLLGVVMTKDGSMAHLFIGSLKTKARLERSVELVKRTSFNDGVEITNDDITLTYREVPDNIDPQQYLTIVAEELDNMCIYVINRGIQEKIKILRKEKSLALSKTTHLLKTNTISTFTNGSETITVKMEGVVAGGIELDSSFILSDVVPIKTPWTLGKFLSSFNLSSILTI